MKNPSLNRKSPILIVEDEYLVAIDLAENAVRNGERVLGPVPSVDAALYALSSSDALAGAILDVRLGSTHSFKVALELTRRNIPFVFYTGQMEIEIPEIFQTVPHLLKPANWSDLKAALSQAIKTVNETPIFVDRPQTAVAKEIDMKSLIMCLRQRAYTLTHDTAGSDRLVEQALCKALNELDCFEETVSLEQSLLDMLETVHQLSVSGVYH
ncbi:hypothetical protein IFT84_06535 [Rhizobium sp. CFBP 8762]|uniref:hypothetical protein n=1 Tax=Rhizobium sp. CFBP 8762 TaxID=2775279 RepID=UPI0017808063|nr:hypothetical protein [Rhizobium sp. CFBP 8762]MBD8554180.1 hypothetical protein [Rhizobium sp. CFBP 8762]